MARLEPTRGAGSQGHVAHMVPNLVGGEGRGHRPFKGPLARCNMAIVVRAVWHKSSTQHWHTSSVPPQWCTGDTPRMIGPYN
jgi:hypothetical protein